MRRSNYLMGVVMCLAMTPSASFAQQQRDNQRNQMGIRNGPTRTGVVRTEHDDLSHADYTATMDANGNAVFTVRAADFLLEKALDAAGSFTLRITQGKDVVSIVSDSEGYLVLRDKSSARLDPRLTDQTQARDAIRAVLLGSQAVRSTRRLGAILESREDGKDESPIIINALIDTAMVAMLDGDPGAIPRVAKRTVRKQVAQMKVVKLLPGEFRDCIGFYENSLVSAWDLYWQCMQWAATVHWFFEDWAEGFCHWEWLGRSQQYIWQFAQCLALPI
jgi:hypothetical protein